MQFSISSLRITNFRQFYGTQELDFKLDKEKNVIIIYGRNGAGKSNILNAMTWCLYGFEIQRKSNIQNKNELPIVNASALDELKPNGKISAEVVIRLKTKDGPWSIKRRIEWSKNAQGDKNSVADSEKLTVTYPDGNQDITLTGSETQIRINQLLPKALIPFFFIDGEQLRNFFQISTPEQIGQAINYISQMQLVTNAQEHLEWVEEDVRRKVKRTTPKVDKILKDLEFYKEEERTKSGMLHNKNELLNTYLEEKSEIDLFLKEHNSVVIRQLQGKRDLLDNSNQRINERLSRAKVAKNSYLVDIAPFIFLKDTINESHNIIQEKVEKGELPPKIRETFIRELLEKGKCICGNPLIGDARRNLELYREKVSLSELSEIVIIGKNQIEEIFFDIHNFTEKMDEFADEIHELETEFTDNKLQLEEISENLKESNNEEIQRKEDRRTDLEIKIRELEQTIHQETLELESIKKLIKGKKVEYDSELEKDQKNIHLKKKLRLIESAITVLNDTEKEIKDRIREQVQDNASSNFLTLISKNRAFQEVIIHDDYTVEVIHTLGWNAINNLSAGEYLIMGLSFMSALMSISGFKAPVIIDTPLGKEDDIHREYITTNLPKYLKGTQLFLLVTPTEYTEEVENNLKQFLLEENYYKILVNEDHTKSFIKREG